MNIVGNGRVMKMSPWMFVLQQGQAPEAVALALADDCLRKH
jgi:hypothetical protein